MEGRLVVVTGAASGIGAACAEAAVAAGATVVAADRKTQPARPGVEPVLVDVTDADHVERLRTTIAERHRRCDAVITSAGVARIGSVTSCTEAEWDESFDVNAKGTWLVCRALLPLLAEAGGGSVVTVASGAGLRPRAELAAYSATKAAVIALTRSIALAYADAGVRANCVCPGMIDTPMNVGILADRGVDELRALPPLGRIGTPQEIADAVLFLAGPGGDFITGATLAIDGGRALH